MSQYEWSSKLEKVEKKYEKIPYFKQFSDTLACLILVCVRGGGGHIGRSHGQIGIEVCVEGAKKELAVGLADSHPSRV